MITKQMLVLQAPLGTRSGYGDHSRSILKSLIALDRFDIKIIPTAWGHTPQNQIDPTTKLGTFILNHIITKLDRQPDVFIQISVANEFNPIGRYNIGITAGVETTIAPASFIEGCNKMNLVLVPSTFTKKILETSIFSIHNKITKKAAGELKLTTPIKVLFEGNDTTVFNGKSTDNTLLANIPEDFLFLYNGHWLDGGIGEDRKDISMLIKTFCSVFKTVTKKRQPALLLKTSQAGFSIGNRDEIINKIKNLTAEFGESCPPVYLIFGDLTESDINNLYNHSKVKAMVMFTKGEGYGRPLAEFATTGKPIIVSKWSGHVDFLPEDHTVFLNGELTPVHSSAQNKFLIKESKWFTVNYSHAAQQLFSVYNNYKKYLLESNGLKINIKNFTQDKMTEKLGIILDENIPTKPEHITLELPQLEKL